MIYLIINTLGCIKHIHVKQKEREKDTQNIQKLTGPVERDGAAGPAAAQSEPGGGGDGS